VNVKPQAGRRGTDILWNVLVQWANYIGRREIRATTRRDPKSFERSRGFRIVSTVIGYSLDGPPQDLMFFQEERDDHGRRHGSGERADGTTVTDQQAPVPLHDGPGPGGTGPETSESGKLPGLVATPPDTGSDSIRAYPTGSDSGRGSDGVYVQRPHGGTEHSAPGSDGAGASVGSGTAQRDDESVAANDAGANADHKRGSEPESGPETTAELLRALDAGTSSIVQPHPGAPAIELG
jgi:hypothetical protein